MTIPKQCPQRVRLLLVENDVDDIHLIEGMLNQATHISCSIEVADSISSAREVLAHREADVVLLDLSLPSAAGLDPLKAIRSIPGLHAVVAVVDSPDVVLGAQVIHSGAQDLLVKTQLTISSIKRVVRYAFERKAVQEELTRLAEEWDATFNAMTDAVCILDHDGRIIRANTAMMTARGKSEAEILGRRCCEAVHSQPQPIEGCPFERSKASGNQELLTMQLGDAWYEVRTDLLETRSGSRGAVHIMHDITDRKAAEAQREELEAQLRQQQKLESVGTLAGGVAHEINNPINGIKNYAQLIKDRLPENPSLCSYADEIIHETDRVATIVRNLLTFARQETPEMRSCHMANVVEDTLSLIRTVIKRDQITLQVEVPADLPAAHCNAQQMQQVLMNLTTNARDALNDRYEGHDNDKVIRINAGVVEDDDRQWLRVTVEDHGTGIPTAIRERIFEPFFTTKPRDIGTGLGLAVSHGIMKDNGGRLTVESEFGKFTRFHMDLPIQSGGPD